MKTYKQWEKSKLSLSQFLSLGDTIDTAIFDHVVGCVPPAYYGGNRLQMGEPYDHNQNDEPVYLSFKKLLGKWQYMGILTTEEFLK